MRAGGILLGGLFASALAIIAMITRANLALALPFAAAAVAVSALLLAGVALPSRTEEETEANSVPVATPFLREWLRGGDFGREEIIRMLDRIDRMGDHPQLSMRPASEVARLVRLPQAEFLAMVARRMDELEGPS